MKIPQKIADHRKIIIIVTIFYSAGIFFLTFPPTKEYVKLLTPWTLLMNMVLLTLYHKPWSVRHLILYIIIAVSGFFMEVAGVYTGLIFGEYQYGHTLGLKVLDTPLIIGINWLMLIYFVFHITGNTRFSPRLQVITGAFLMVGYDMVLEPVAIRMDMWNWSEGVIPFHNYAAWYIISLVFLSMLHIFKVNAKNRVSSALFAIQAGFIIALNIIYRFI